MTCPSKRLVGNKVVLIRQTRWVPEYRSEHAYDDVAFSQEPHPTKTPLWAWTRACLRHFEKSNDDRDRDPVVRVGKLWYCIMQNRAVLGQNVV
jgi:hypothetical protein